MSISLFGRTKNIFQKIIASDFIFALLLSFAFFLMSNIITGWRIIYSTNDDYYISLLMCNGDDRSIFINYFLSFFIVSVQRMINTVNIYMVFQLFVSIVSMYIINYVFLKLFDRTKAVVMAVSFNLIFAITAYVYLQWTQTSTIAASAGLILFFYVMFSKKNNYQKKTIRVFYLIIACSLVVLSSWFRFISFELCLVLFIFFIIVKILISFIYLIKDKTSVKASFRKVLNVYLKPLLILFIVAVLAFGTQLISESIKSNSSEYSDFKNYNNARGSAVDYGRASFEGNEKFYNSIDIKSQNDLDMLGTWHGDEDFFTKEKLQEISDYSSNPQFNLRFNFSYLLKLVNDKLELLFGNLSIIVFIILLFIFIGSLVLLFVFREKLKFLFLILNLLIWISFFLVFKVGINTITIIPIAVFSILGACIFDRYFYIISMTMSFCIFVLYIYLNFTRISFRTVYNISLPVVLILVFSFSESFIRLSSKAVINNSIIKSGCFILLIIITAGAGWYIAGNEVCNKSRVPDENLRNYLEENNQTTYVCDLNSMNSVSINYDNPLAVPKTMSNVIDYMGWIVGSPYYHNELNREGINELFNDSIDNKKIKFIFKHEEKCDYRAMYEQFFDEHYGNVLLLKEKEIGEYCIYSVKEELVENKIF